MSGLTVSEASSYSERNPLAELRQVEEEERTAFQSRSVQSKQVSGHRYDLFVQEMVARRETEARVRAARGGQEYYAPERHVEEFYGQVTRD